VNYWLVKSEPFVFSIQDLKRDKVTLWDGVRNYQARNFLKEMKKGDTVLYYHSREDPIGVAGIATIHKEAYPDPTQFDKRNKYFDPKATKENPRWFCPDLKFKKAFKEVVTLAEMRENKSLEGMVLLKKGSRLSVQPVTKKQYDSVLKMAS
jgi:predicted RNA-binding protein with PUA-like domain